MTIIFNQFESLSHNYIFARNMQSYLVCVFKLSNIVFFGLTLSQTSPGFYVSAVQVFRKTLLGKGEIAHNSQQCFLPFLRTLCHFHQI